MQPRYTLEMDGELDMHPREYLDRAINECERRILVLGHQLQIDRGYVDSPDADPADIDTIRYQLELEIVEKEYLEKTLAILEKWLADPRSPIVTSEVGITAYFPRFLPRVPRGSWDRGF